MQEIRQMSAKRGKGIFFSYFLVPNVRAQRPGPGFYCTIRAGALLKRLKLQIPFQMHPPTWCNDQNNPGLGAARLCVPCMSMQRTLVVTLLKKFKNTNKISGANNKWVQIFRGVKVPYTQG
jgi:hypothetical protein